MTNAEIRLRVCVSACNGAMKEYRAIRETLTPEEREAYVSYVRDLYTTHDVAKRAFLNGVSKDTEKRTRGMYTLGEMFGAQLNALIGIPKLECPRPMTAKELEYWEIA